MTSECIERPITNWQLGITQRCWFLLNRKSRSVYNGPTWARSILTIWTRTTWWQVSNDGVEIIVFSKQSLVNFVWHRFNESLNCSGKVTTPSPIASSKALPRNWTRIPALVEWNVHWATHDRPKRTSLFERTLFHQSVLNLQNSLVGSIRGAK